MKPPISGRTVIGGVVGHPVAHSLSPAIHNAWLEALGYDGIYLAFGPGEAGFETMADAVATGALRGLNVTVPFKERALARAVQVRPAALGAGAANLLILNASGQLEADNTDGAGLLYALRLQAAYNPATGPVVLLGAGGAARGAAYALKQAGASDVRIVNRTRSRAEHLAQSLGLTAYAMTELEAALVGATCLVNSTSAQLSGEGLPPLPWHAMAEGAVAMDMVYVPLVTPLLQSAQAAGLRIVDGLDMLIGQARPSFEALFGQPPPDIDIRTLVLDILARRDT